MRLNNNAEVWEKVYDAFQQINFAAWDYNTIKQSLLDYVKVYKPEDFNDYIESSEFITILELFAYVGELLSYRLDINAHENFITTARRKESVLRLAKTLSYTASRNIPARGLVKITSISTTEKTFDSSGKNITNKTIYWNDPNNPNWKEQFILVMNRVLGQKFGSVLASDRVQVNDILFELYRMNGASSNPEVLSFPVSVSGNSYPMEIVPTVLDAETGPMEKRPETKQQMTVMYLNDGLGDSSENSGFFFYVKQGTLERVRASFDGVTPNQFYDINVENCNQSDVWVNNVDPVTGKILDEVINGSGTKSGEWEVVDIANSQNVLFNTTSYKNKYEVQTMDLDKIRIIFGDGNFANIPSGTFDIWYRRSANEDIVIPTSSIQNVPTSISYHNGSGREENITFSVSLISPIQNSAISEDIEHIRRIAPAVYYTQDRMVNGKDYNEFMLQDNSILKLRAVNRTFAGDSKYIKWHDPRENYENVKIFGDDLVLYFNTFETVFNVSGDEIPPPDGGSNTRLVDAIYLNYIQPILDSEPYFIKSILYGIEPLNIRKQFNASENIAIKSALRNVINAAPDKFFIYFDRNNNTFSVSSNEEANWDVSVALEFDGNWTIIYNGLKITAHSDSTKFWQDNNNKKIITYDTLNTNYDNIVVLKANPSSDGNGILDKNYQFRVIRQELIESGEFAGQYSIHDLSVIPDDTDNDYIPDDVRLSGIINIDTDFVYFNRDGLNSPWKYVPSSIETLMEYENDVENSIGLWKREIGRDNLNFAWFHRTPNYHLIDPSSTNIIDMYIVPRGYYLAYRMWLNNDLNSQPIPPTSYQLRGDYRDLLESKMISDTIILHPGKIKVIFGPKADSSLRGNIKVVKASQSTLTNNQIKTGVVDATKEFFDINKWEFGETFYFSELASYIHLKIGNDIDSVVLVPTMSNQSYGDLQQIYAGEDEIIQPHITVNNVEIVESLNPKNLKQIL